MPKAGISRAGLDRIRLLMKAQHVEKPALEVGEDDEKGDNNK